MYVVCCDDVMTPSYYLLPWVCGLTRDHVSYDRAIPARLMAACCSAECTREYDGAVLKRFSNTKVATSVLYGPPVCSVRTINAKLVAFWMSIAPDAVCACCSLADGFPFSRIHLKF